MPTNAITICRRSTMNQGKTVRQLLVALWVIGAFLAAPYEAITASSNSAALHLDRGAGEYVFIADADQRGLDITRDITIELWVKLESEVPINDSFAFVSKADSPSNYSYIFSVENDAVAGEYLDFRYSSDGTSESATTHRKSITLVPGQWYHLAVTADVSARLVSFFVDGIEFATDTIIADGSSSIFRGTATFRIGAGNGGQGLFDGLIDEVRIFNKRRTTEKIATDFNIEIAPSTAGLVGYWKFNGSFLDETSHRNDLSIHKFSVDVPF